jgi:GxxExxY protein
MIYRNLTKDILESVYKVHTSLGPGLLENAYETCLYYELTKRQLNVDRQIPLPLIYDGIHLDAGYRVDLIVEKKVILELKSVDAIHPIHIAQVITYLKLSSIPIGFVLNFNVSSMKNGIKRVANKEIINSV